MYMSAEVHICIMVCTICILIHTYLWCLIDINECESQLSSQCDHSCVNSVGSFSCVCNFGYRMAEDGRHCIGELLLYVVYELHNSIIVNCLYACRY